MMKPMMENMFKVERKIINDRNTPIKVSGSAESVGAHTTSSVVQSIFVVIVLDAVAAMFFMEMGW